METQTAPTPALQTPAPTQAQTTAIQPAQELKQPIAFGNNGVKLSSFEDAYRFAVCVTKSGWAPKGMEKPESVLIALQHGAELGLPPMAALQNIAVINGRPGIYGDAALALVRASGLLESYAEKEIGTQGKDDWGFAITTKRKGEEPTTERFTVADAKLASLWGKSGPWTQYPKRMLKFRARGFLLRDVYGDVLKGLRTLEELQDVPAAARNVTPVRGLAAMVDDAEPQMAADATQSTSDAVPANAEVMP